MTFDNNYKILVVDDAKDTQLLLEFDLTLAGYQVICCDSGEESLLKLAEEEVDIILLDMYMPGLSGLATLKQIKSNADSVKVPVIMLSASNDEDEVVAALELGADDYVVKPYIAKILLARIRTSIRLKEKTQQLEYLAKTDFLTKINNRGSFFELSTHALNLGNRSNHPITVAMFDIDFFKQVNDDYGHEAGDNILIAFAKQLTNIFRGYDIIGRIGGEEFAVCLPNTYIDHAKIVCERLREHIEHTLFSIEKESNETVGKCINITVSIGLVLANSEPITIDGLLKKADEALYYAKEHGRNQVVDINDITNKSVIIKQEYSNNTQEVTDVIPSEENLNSESKDAIAGIDFSVGVNNVLGDESLFNEILVMFYQDHHLDGEKLTLAIQNQDIASAKHLAHTLKGVSCSVGAMDLFEKTKVLDLAINEDKTSELESLITLLLPELNKVMQSIKANLDVSEA